jgi:FkbM family methyltransferase
LAADLTLNLENGTKVVVPNRLDAMTTYVILEQERWFEKEWGFIPHLLRPGMIALDIGANLGTYTTAIAKAVGPGGQVFAYEPTSETRARLERTVAINDQRQVTVVASALSDTEREGRIVFGESSELNHLGEAGEGKGEAVHLTSLDLEKLRLGWDRIDFIKMDAEGEELKIIAGGSSVFEAGAPIVMFEIKAAATYEPAIARTLSGLGYGLYRLLPDERHLVPFDENEVDGFELNVFAVKPEAAPALVERDLLAEPSEVSPPSGNWAAWSGEQPFARMLAGLPPARDATFQAGLDCYAAWRDESRAIGPRYAALRRAIDLFDEALKGGPTLPRLIAAARSQYDAGLRSSANALAVEAAKLIDAGALLAEQFPPLTARYEPLIGEIEDWLTMSLLETLEQSTKYSGFFGKVRPQVNLMAGSRYLTVEIERRRALSAVFRGESLELRMNLSRPMPGHLNAETWTRLIG